MNVEELTRKFLLAYESRDIATIATMFHPEIILRDWNAEIIGKRDALDEFGKNFEQATNLKIVIKTIYNASLSAAAEIEIMVNNTEKLNVVDVLTFNSEGKILSVFAYRGL